MISLAEIFCCGNNFSKSNATAQFILPVICYKMRIRSTQPKNLGTFGADQMIRGGAMVVSPVQTFFFSLLTRNKPFFSSQTEKRANFSPHFFASFVDKPFIFHRLLNKLFFHHFLPKIFFLPKKNHSPPPPSPRIIWSAPYSSCCCMTCPLHWGGGSLGLQSFCFYYCNTKKRAEDHKQGFDAAFHDPKFRAKWWHDI